MQHIERRRRATTVATRARRSPATITVNDAMMVTEHPAVLLERITIDHSAVRAVIVTTESIGLPFAGDRTRFPIDGSDASLFSLKRRGPIPTLTDIPLVPNVALLLAAPTELPAHPGRVPPNVVYRGLWPPEQDQEVRGLFLGVEDPEALAGCTRTMGGPAPGHNPGCAIPGLGLGGRAHGGIGPAVDTRLETRATAGEVVRDCQPRRPHPRGREGMAGLGRLSAVTQDRQPA